MSPLGAAAQRGAPRGWAGPWPAGSATKQGSVMSPEGDKQRALPLSLPRAPV